MRPLRQKGEKFVDDNRIVELYLSRNEEAINQTALKYGSKLRKIANNILNDPETAKECENDTYNETWNLIPPHEPRTYLFAFVGRIVRNIALNVCKKNSARKRFAVHCELTKEMEECLPAGNDPEEEADAQFLREQIDAFLENCPKDQRIIFVRRYWYFDSVEQIARTCGFSESKVKTVLFRLRAALKSHLEKGGYAI